MLVMIICFSLKIVIKLDYKKVVIKFEDVNESIDLLSFFKWELVENNELGRKNELLFVRNKSINNYQDIVALENVYFSNKIKVFRVKIMIVGIILMLAALLSFLIIIFPFKSIIHSVVILLFLIVIAISVLIFNNYRRNKLNIKNYELDLMKINILTEVLKLH